jgi:hypothetical protein
MSSPGAAIFSRATLEPRVSGREGERGDILSILQKT